MENVLLSAVDIAKAYGRHKVLGGVSLSIRKGEAVALVGENGCGKSTLIRVLCGMTAPTGGSITVRPGARLALIPDRYEGISMTARKFLRHMLALEGAEWSAAEGYYREFRLEGMLDTPMKYLSKGTLQKIAAIQALAGERDALFMDEPLSGQDAVSKAGFAAELRRRKENGMAVVMACHEPYLIEELADRIVQIKDGALIEGAGYVFGRKRSVCLFLLDFSGSESDLLGLAGSEEIKAGMAVTRLGTMYALRADRAYARELFRLLIARDVRIVKYEESEEQC